MTRLEIIKFAKPPKSLEKGLLEAGQRRGD